MSLISAEEYIKTLEEHNKHYRELINILVKIIQSNTMEIKEDEK